MTVPPNVAEEDLRNGGMPEHHVECAHEVVNVLSRLLNSASTPHLRLGKTHQLPCELPEDVVRIMDQPQFRRATSWSSSRATARAASHSS